MFNVHIREYFSVLNVSIVCIRNTARSKSIPLLCSHVGLYKFSTVHPPSTHVVRSTRRYVCYGCKVASLLWFAHFGMRICGGAQLLSSPNLVDHTSLCSFSKWLSFGLVFMAPLICWTYKSEWRLTYVCDELQSSKDVCCSDFFKQKEINAFIKKLWTQINAWI